MPKTPKKVTRDGKYHLTIEQKRKFLEKRDEPQHKGQQLWSRAIAAYFSEKWGRSISKSTIQRTLEKRNDIISLPDRATKKVRVIDSVEQNFERDVIVEMTQKFTKSNINYELGLQIAERVQNRFSRNWWQPFTKRHGWS